MSEYGTHTYKEYGSEGRNSLYLMVRFAEDGKNHPKQFGTIKSINDPIPDEAVYGSSIYFLTANERDRNRSFKTGWEMEGECIAKELQDRCERRDEVLYPVHIESDADVALPTQLNWIWALIEESLPVSPGECAWYYSGGRSIHAHVPLFVRDDGRKYLKDLVKEYPRDLDDSIYQTKPQFRLPGAVHDENGLPKTLIDPERRHDKPKKGQRAIVGEAVQADPVKPETYADLLRKTFGPGVLDDPTDYLWEPDIGPDIKSEPHHWEPGQPEPEGEISEKWKAYNLHAFSPYANAGNGKQSLVVARPVGGAYGQDGDAYLPCRIIAAVGCDREYTVYEEHYPVLLSDGEERGDYQKLVEKGIGQGDAFVLIGGHSRQSKIHKVEPWLDDAIAGMLISDERDVDPNRVELTLEYIKGFDYDTGSPGPKGDRDPGVPPGWAETDPREELKTETEAMRLKRQIERDGLQSVSNTYEALLRVTCRLLRIDGWDGAWNWLQDVLGDDFDAADTHQKLEDIVEQYPDSYGHVTVPERNAD